MDFERYKKMNDDKPGFGELAGATVAHSYKNDACGDGYVIYLKVKDGFIEDAKYTTSGCGFGLAALEVATRLVKGKRLEEAAKLSAADIEADFAFPERRKTYPEIVSAAVREAVEEARGKAAA